MNVQYDGCAESDIFLAVPKASEEIPTFGQVIEGHKVRYLAVFAVMLVAIFATYKITGIRISNGIKAMQVDQNKNTTTNLQGEQLNLTYVNHD